jgi:zinc transport system ATP-binding protein
MRLRVARPDMRLADDIQGGSRSVSVSTWRERSAGTAPLISADAISVIYRGKPAIEGVSVAVHSGEIVTLVGPNGAGKTTLVRSLLGLAPLAAGRVSRQANLRIGYVPQRFPVEPIVPLPVGRFMTLTQGVPPRRAVECLEETGAIGLLDQQMSELSGGEFQRVLLARALARDPQLLVLDEPAQAVDFAGASHFYSVIAAIRDRRGCGILLVSHDLHVVLGASDRVVCINRHVCCEGVPHVVAGHPEYVRLFGPEASASLGLYAHRHDHTHTLSGEVACGHVHE